MDLTKLTKEELKQLLWLIGNNQSAYLLYGGDEFYEKVLDEFDKRGLKVI